MSFPEVVVPLRGLNFLPLLTVGLLPRSGEVLGQLHLVIIY